MPMATVPHRSPGFDPARKGKDIGRPEHPRIRLPLFAPLAFSPHRWLAFYAKKRAECVILSLPVHSLSTASPMQCFHVATHGKLGTARPQADQQGLGGGLDPRRAVLWLECDAHCPQREEVGPLCSDIPIPYSGLRSAD